MRFKNLLLVIHVFLTVDLSRRSIKKRLVSSRGRSNSGFGQVIPGGWAFEAPPVVDSLANSEVASNLEHGIR